MHHIASFRKYVKSFMCFQRAWKCWCIFLESLSKWWPKSCWPITSKYSLKPFISQDQWLLLPLFYKRCYCQTFLQHSQTLFTALQAHVRVDGSFRTWIFSSILIWHPNCSKSVDWPAIWVSHRNCDENTLFTCNCEWSSVNSCIPVPICPMLYLMWWTQN